MRGLAGKVFVVAGGGTGIGRAAAIRLAEEGAKVIVGDVDLENAAETADRGKRNAKGDGTASAVRFDMADEASIAALIKAAVTSYGGLDGIHVNANDMRAVMKDGDAVDVSLEIFDRTIAVGIKGHLLCARYAIPELLKRGGGAIVHTTSTASYTGASNRVSYGIAKAGVNALVRHIARRWGKDNIRCNAVAPGYVRNEAVKKLGETDMYRAVLASTPSPRLGEPSDLANMVAMLLSDDANWVNGQIITVDGGNTMRS